MRKMYNINNLPPRRSTRNGNASTWKANMEMRDLTEAVV